MTFLRRTALLAGFSLAGAIAVADEPKTAPAVKLAPAEKKDDAKTEKQKAEEEAKKQQEEIEKAQREYEAQIKKAQQEGEKLASHKLHKEVKLTGKSGNGLQTLAVDADGRVLALVAPPRGYSAAQKGVSSAVHILDGDGKETDKLTVDFHATAVNAAPDGTIFVAGDGKLAKFDKKGKAIGGAVELPFIAEALKDKDKMKAKAEKQVKDQKESFQKIVQQYKDRLAKLEEKEKAAKEKGEELTKAEATQLKQSKQILESYKQTEQYYESVTVESVLEGMLGRVKIVNSVSANDKELFLVCGETEGYGYSLWRMDLDLKNAKKIMGGMSGCCGQMDVQCCGGDIVVAENTKHRFARYDRDGKELATGGKQGKETDPGCFGGCCNPMNVKACGEDVLTAESEGLIKRFGPTGEFKGVVGSVAISGGCKNVAVGSNADASRVYFCDQPGSRVLILAKKEEKKPEAKKDGK